MEFCRKASELKPLSDLDFFVRLKEAVDMDLDETVLGIRSGSLFYDILKSKNVKIDEEKEWRLYLDRLNEVKDYLRLEGYIRHDMDNFMTPERYFAEMYAIPLGLVDKRTCQPYFYSNEVYETYAFNWDRVRMIMNILYDVLTFEQFVAVSNDIMNADKYCVEDSSELDAARRFMRENRKRLGQRFKVCWWT